MKITLLFLSLLLATIELNAQGFAIKKVELSSDKVYVHYDLIDTIGNHSYTINLFYSKDNFISPLQKVKGDIGLEVRPGANKKIIWSAKEELGPTFTEDDISLEVKGRLYIPFIRLDGEYATFKRAKKYEITWTGGTQQNILNFDLYKGTNKITSFPNIANVGHYSLTIPNSVKVGRDFRFRISDSKNKDQIVNTKTFSIQRRVPLVYKIAAPVIIGIGTYLYIIFTKPIPPKPLGDPLLPGGLGG